VKVKINGVDTATPYVVGTDGTKGLIYTTVTGTAAWTQQDAELFAFIPAPVCIPGRDPLVAFDWDTGDGSGSISSASYYLDNGTLQRYDCTLTPAGPNDSDGFLPPEPQPQLGFPLAHFLGTSDPSLTCKNTDGSTVGCGSGEVRKVTLTFSLCVAPGSPDAGSTPCADDPSKVLVDSAFPYTLSAVRRAS
jgi:hypothetical protein